MFKTLFKLNERYTNFLVMNWHYLNAGSRIALEELDPNGFRNVFYSTVVEVNTPREYQAFQKLLAGLPKASLQARLNVLENSVAETNKADQLLTLKDFKKVCAIVQKNDLSNRHVAVPFTGKPLHEWI